MSRGRTLTRRILESRATGEGIAGSDYFEVEPDLVLGHDATIALIVDRIAAAGGRLPNPEKLFLVADHFAPPSTVDRANILRKFLDFAEQTDSGELHLFQGICHQLLVESKRCVPGTLIVGADSHTTMAGALGAFACGMGSTDILAVLLTGRTWLRVPAALRVVFGGRMPAHLRGKDLALRLLALLGEGGAGYRSLEFEDRSEGHGIPMDGRLTLSNMAVECGAKNGIWIPDRCTRDSFEALGGIWPEGIELRPDADADYEREIEVGLGDLEPQIARPWSPANVTPVAGAAGTKVHQVFIGSCAGGRLEELEDAATVLRGRRIPRLLKVVITPASVAVYREALRRGWIGDLIDAGAVLTNPSCGACGGIDKGLVAAGEVCVSTSNRNFRGRMGDVDAEVYLASGLSAAAAALTGRITDPREVLR